MKSLAALVMVLTVVLLAEVGHGWRRRRRGGKIQASEEFDKKMEEAAWDVAMEGLESLAEKLKDQAEGSFKKKEEPELQLEENDGDLETEKEETGGGLVMEELKELQGELEILKEDIQKGK